MVLKYDLDIWRGNQGIVPDVYHLFLPEQSLICSSLWIGIHKYLVRWGEGGGGETFHYLTKLVQIV